MTLAVQFKISEPIYQDYCLIFFITSTPEDYDSARVGKSLTTFFEEI